MVVAESKQMAELLALRAQKAAKVSDLRASIHANIRSHFAFGASIFRFET